MEGASQVGEHRLPKLDISARDNTAFSVVGKGDRPLASPSHIQANVLKNLHKGHERPTATPGGRGTTGAASIGNNRVIRSSQLSEATSKKALPQITAAAREANRSGVQRNDSRVEIATKRSPRLSEWGLKNLCTCSNIAHMVQTTHPHKSNTVDVHT